MPRGFISTTAADKRDLIIYFIHSPVKKVFDAEIRVLEKFAADWARGERDVNGKLPYENMQSCDCIIVKANSHVSNQSPEEPSHITIAKNVPTMHHGLPVPLLQLDILILRPRKQTDQPNIINYSAPSSASDVRLLPHGSVICKQTITQEVAPDDLEILVADIENDDLGYDVSVIPDLKGSESIVFSERFVIDCNKVCDDASAARTARGSAPGGSPKARREEV
ncbi:hypothetical protein E4U48_006779 [Claviceps purpurea]|nr:hypothetical protein E4U48_006779 [Claviceps purpurea]